MKFKTLTCILFLLCSEVVFAVETASSELGTKVPTANVSILEWLLSCIAVIFLLFGLAYLLKRAKFIPGLKGGVLKVEAMINVGNRERVALVKAGSQYLLIGITQTQITRLGEIDLATQDQEDKPADTKKNDAFSDKLFAMLGKTVQSDKKSNDASSSQESTDNRNEIEEKSSQSSKGENQ